MLRYFIPLSTLLLAGSVTPAYSNDSDVVNAVDFGARPDGSDSSYAVRKAIEHCRETGSRRLVFAPGQYDFWPDRAVEEYLFISNHADALRRVAFPLKGMKAFEVDGQGATFIFHRNICPFYIDRSTQVVLRNFTVDFARTIHSEARIEAAGEGSLDLTISQAYPYTIRNGLLVFTDGAGTEFPYTGLLEWDTARRETAFKVRDYWTGPNLHATEVEPGRVRLFWTELTGTPGNTLVFLPKERLSPGITISDSAQVRISKVTLHHSGGMGVIAQRSRDIDLDELSVTPASGKGRIVSLTADATHFVNCSGRIRIQRCLFENQLDDASNIHGLYARVTQRIGPRSIEVKLVHPEQLGIDFIVPGKPLELVRSASMQLLARLEVESVERLNKEYTRVKFRDELPEALAEGDAVAAVGSDPEVLIKDCIIRNNRARGLLLGSRGRTVIEGNRFHVPGASIAMGGEARYWYEQGGVRDVVIRSNVFENCNYGVWGNAIFQFGAGVAEAERERSRYHRNVVIEDNAFRIFDPRLVQASFVDGLVFRRNRLETSSKYPPQNAGASPFEIRYCDNVHVEPPIEAEP